LKRENALPGETWVGLLLLLIILAVAVATTAPKFKTPEEQAKLLRAHEDGLYFIEAELMAKKLFPDPAYRWSVPLNDGGKTRCSFAGNGVWYACGTISAEPGRQPTPPVWQMFFVPETHELLFMRLGHLATGNAQAALLRAKAGTGESPGDSHGK
jgi:hypothetical protein